MPGTCRFHLAIPVDDLVAAQRFYGELLGCAKGRSAPHWIDFDFFGHQLTVHLVEHNAAPAACGTNPVDGDAVPIRHFGVILDRSEWERLVARLEAAGCAFLVGPRVRFAGQVGEQATLFIEDPAGNALEFKSFADDARVFAH